MTFKLKPLSETDDTFVIGLYQNPVIMRHIGAVLTDHQANGLGGKMRAEADKNKAIYQVIMTADGKQRVGLLSMHWKAESCHIESGMIILPAFQNQGVCRWAQMEALHLVKNIFPVKVCTVYIRGDNVAANTSYKKMGFVPVENTSKLTKHLNLIRWDFNMELLK